jgi:hypothetical protein
VHRFAVIVTSGLIVLLALGREAGAQIGLTGALNAASPVADAVGPLLLPWGQDLALNATASYDPDAPCGDAIAEYRWDLGDDGSVERTTTSELTTIAWADVVTALPGIAPPLPYAGWPVQLVRLEVTDAGGHESSALLPLQVISTQPLARGRATPSIVVVDSSNQATVQLDGSLSRAGFPGGSIVLYEWDLNGNAVFGEAGVDASGASISTILTSPPPPPPGLPALTGHLRVTDNAGGQSTAPVQVEVLPQGSTPRAPRSHSTPRVRSTRMQGTGSSRSSGTSTTTGLPSPA